jgi:hypothetical protein
MKMSASKRAIDKIYKRRDRYEIPDWQRGEVWSLGQKQSLIDSILREWKLPKFYFLRLSENETEVVDGQQRLSAIFEFYGNEFPLSKASAKRFGGPYYRDLSQIHSDAFDDFEIEFDQIEDADESELKEFFQRLQQGLPLTTSEKLNSVHSKLRDFCRKMAAHSFFVKRVSASNKRFGHFDIVAKVAAVEIEGLEVSLRYDDLRAIFESQVNFSQASIVGRRIKEALDYLDVVFQEEHSSLLLNRSMVQSFITLSAYIVRLGKGAGSEERMRNFFEHFMKELSIQVELGQRATDQDYIAFQRTVSANVKGGPRTRHKILLKKLLIFYPNFAQVLGPESLADSGISGHSAQLGESIVQLITQINAGYSAKKGEDLIKLTNKNLKALSEIGRPISDLAGYGSFIDNLYFVFHEGVSDRLQGSKPESFSDINILRTDLRHDVDHGGGAKFRSKKKKFGTTFSKYGGEGTPETLDPTLFSIVQSKILHSVKTDLEILLRLYS